MIQGTRHFFTLSFLLVIHLAGPLDAMDNASPNFDACDKHDYSSYSSKESIDKLLNYVEVNRGINEDSLRIHGYQAVCASQAINYVEGEIHGLLLLGFDYYNHANQDSALFYLTQAYFLAETTNHRPTLARAANYLSYVYYALKRINLAMSYAQQNYTISEELGDYRRMGEALNDIGTMYTRIGNPKESRRCQLEALELFSKVEVPSDSYIWTYRALAISYAKENDRENAEAYFAKAINMGKEYDYPLATCWNLYDLAKYRFRNGDPNTMILLDDLNAINKSNGANIHIDVASRFHEAKIYNAQNEIQKAQSTAANALQIAQIHKLNHLSLELIDLLIEIADKQNAPLDKFNYLNQAKNIYSLQGVQVAKSLNVWMDLQKRLLEEERKNIKLQKTKIDADRKAFTYKVIIGIALLALLGAYLFIRSRNRAKVKLESINNKLLDHKGKIENQLTIIQSHKQQLQTYNTALQDEQQKMSNELKQRIIEIAHKEEILDELQSIFDKSAMPTDPKKKINQLIGIRQRETIWKDFDEKIALTHTHFFKALAEHAPQLTHNDFRMAALVKMNMSNKEIARILRKSVQSVHMTQSRLRKKLRLNEKDVSLGVLLKRFEGEGIDTSKNLVA